MSDVIGKGVITITKSRISLEMIRKITRPLINATWRGILAEVPYASKVINILEKQEVYQGDSTRIRTDDPIIKPDHTAARGFVDSGEREGAFINFDPAKASYDKLVECFSPSSGAATQALILQILGAKVASGTYKFPHILAEGKHLCFEGTGDLILDHTKHFISCQDIALLEPRYRDTIRKAISGVAHTITDEDWSALKTLYKGGVLSDKDADKLVQGLEKRVFSRRWEIDVAVAALLQQGADEGKKPLEYAYSTYLRGNGLNHGTWRVADIIKGFGVLHMMGTNPVSIRGYRTLLEQTAGMAATILYKAKNNHTWKGPGAFLEIASRPYMLLNNRDNPVDCVGREVNLARSELPYLFHEVVIQLDEATWLNSKAFIDQDGKEVTLQAIQEGKYGEGTRLIGANGQAFCYEGFKEDNAKGIFFAAGGNVKNVERA